MGCVCVSIVLHVFLPVRQYRAMDVQQDRANGPHGRCQRVEGVWSSSPLLTVLSDPCRPSVVGPDITRKTFIMILSWESTESCDCGPVGQKDGCAASPGCCSSFLCVPSIHRNSTPNEKNVFVAVGHCPKEPAGWNWSGDGNKHLILPDLSRCVKSDRKSCV